MLFTAAPQIDERNPFWVYPAVLGGLTIIGLLLRWLDRRFPSKKSHRGSIGNALMRVEANFLLGREHVMEAIEREDAEEDDSGEPPETGTPRTK